MTLIVISRSYDSIKSLAQPKLLTEEPIAQMQFISSEPEDLYNRSSSRVNGKDRYSFQPREL